MFEFILLFFEWNNVIKFIFDKIDFIKIEWVLEINKLLRNKCIYMDCLRLKIIFYFDIYLK